MHLRPARLALARRSAEGIPMDEPSWAQLVDAGRRVGVDVAGVPR